MNSAWYEETQTLAKILQQIGKRREHDWDDLPEYSKAYWLEKAERILKELGQEGWLLSNVYAYNGIPPWA